MLYRQQTDLLVVGAGPAGSSAALAAARKGADVLLVEQKAQVGYPVQCAEFVPARLIGDFDLDPGICVQKIVGMDTYVEGKFENYTSSPGWMINRDVMDRQLAQKAEDAGATLLTSTKVIKLHSDGTISLTGKGREEIRLAAKIVIAADGPRSKMRRWVKAPELNLLPGVQMSFALKNKTDRTCIYLSSSIRGGYGWLFPKGEIAHIGLGFARTGQNEPRATQLLKSFARMLKDRGDIVGAPIDYRAGWIPVSTMPTAVHGNIVFAGDAAGHTHPITGAGIFAALTCGEMAGQHAAKALKANDFNKLQEYDREWLDLLGRTLNHARQKRQRMEAEWGNFAEIIRSCWIGFREYYA